MAPARTGWPTRWRSRAGHSSGARWRRGGRRASRSAAPTWRPPRSSTPPTRSACASAGLADAGALLEAELIPGAPAYRRRTLPTVAEAIGVIHAAGGVAVWAHPFWDLDADAAVLDAIDRFAAAGLDGVEAFYITHTEAQTRLLRRPLRRRGLLTTGSADFHGPEHPRFHAFRAFETYDLVPDLGPLAG